MKSKATVSEAVRGGERHGEEEREGRRMKGGDGGRQQVVVMHRATFLATLIANEGLGDTFTKQVVCG